MSHSQRCAKCRNWVHDECRLPEGTYYCGYCDEIVEPMAPRSAPAPAEDPAP